MRRNRPKILVRDFAAPLGKHLGKFRRTLGMGVGGISPQVSWEGFMCDICTESLFRGISPQPWGERFGGFRRTFEGRFRRMVFFDRGISPQPKMVTQNGISKRYSETTSGGFRRTRGGISPHPWGGISPHAWREFRHTLGPDFAAFSGRGFAFSFLAWLSLQSWRNFATPLEKDFAPHSASFEQN